MPRPDSSWDREVDVLVFGSGAAGMAAALVAAQEGQRVLLCEKSALIGGTTAISGGEMWIPNSRHARERGIDDSVDNAARYWEAEAGGDARTRAHRQAFLRHAPEAIDYLERHGELQFRAVSPHPDYHQDLPGASAGGRPLGTVAFDGRRLGADFALLRPPRKDFMVFGGMMVTRDDITVLLKPFASWKAFAAAAALLGRFLRDRLSHPRGTRLVLGNALAARLLLSLRAKGVEIAVESPLQSLVCEGAAVTGAVVALQGRATRVRARAVVLATGGFAASPTLRARYMPGLQVDHALCFAGDTGDALSAALAVGAAVDDAVQTPAYWMPASVLTAPDGTRTVFPHIRDRARPGLIAVNAQGRRFVNESASYHDVSLAMFEQARGGVALPAWLVCDRRFVREHGIGMIKPFWQRLRPYVRAGYLVEGRTLAELALRIGVDAAALMQAVADHNASALSGVDAGFGKGSSIYNRHYGDPSHGPNPCLKPIEQGPFYAVAVAPAPIGTTVGLRTDEHANVLDAQGAPIAGLYACGNDMASVTRGAYPGPGSTLGPGVVFAWLAMQHVKSQLREACDERP